MMFETPCSSNPLPDDALPALEHRVEQAAHRVGVAAATIEQLPFDLAALQEDGIFINVDARGFGILDRRLDWQALEISLATFLQLATDLARRLEVTGHVIPEGFADAAVREVRAAIPSPEALQKSFSSAIGSG